MEVKRAERATTFFMTKLFILLKKISQVHFSVPIYISRVGFDVYEGHSFYTQTLKLKNTVEEDCHSDDYENILIDTLQFPSVILGGIVYGSIKQNNNIVEWS